MHPTTEDKEQIRELLASYCYHVDSGQAEKYVELFADDCIVELGPLGSFKGKSALLELQQRKGGKPTQVRHITTNIVSSIQGDTAQVKSYVMALKIDTTPPTLLFSGHYSDDLVKLEGRWLFRSRRASTDIPE